MSGDARALFRALRRAKWYVVPTGSGHFEVYTPSGRKVTTVSATPSDHRSWPNALASLRRAGFHWPPPQRQPKRRSAAKES